MKTRKNPIIKTIIACLGIFMSSAFIMPNVFADDIDESQYYGISVSPMNQKIILTPGETYRGTFNITNPATHTTDFNYVIGAKPFYVDDDYDIFYDNNGDYNKIVDWITVEDDRGVISPNQTKEVAFTINVPSNAPSGGQYSAIIISSDNDDNGLENGVNIKISQSIAHIIYAEIAGTTVRQGEVQDINVPSFLFSGNISGISSIKNTGNVHGTATYKLQVFPLFSDEELYTTEENPEQKTILPDRTLMNATSWDKTPNMGIFNVIYTAEFEGVTTEVKKMVIVCPIWLLAIIIFAIISIIIYLVAKSRNRKKSGR